MKKRFKKGVKAYATLPVEIKAVDKENFTLSAVVSTQTVDRHGDVILQDGWDLKNFKRNPVILNSHRYDDATETIGRADSTKTEGTGKGSKLIQKIRFAVNENPKAKVIFDLYAGGYLSAFSVGFIPKEFGETKDGKTDWFTIAQAELLEVSAVSVPANALALAKQKGIDVDVLESKNEDGDPEADDPDAEPDEIPEDTQVPDDNEEEPASDGDDPDEDKDEKRDQEDGDEPGDEPPVEDAPGGEDTETSDEKRARLTEERARIEAEIAALGEDGDDAMISHTGRTYNAKVIDAIRNIQKREHRKLQRVARIVHEMLDAGNDGVKVNRSTREQIRKRRVNQAIRTLFTLK